MLFKNVSLYKMKYFKVVRGNREGRREVRDREKEKGTQR